MDQWRLPEILIAAQIVTPTVSGPALAAGSFHRGPSRNTDWRNSGPWNRRLATGRSRNVFKHTAKTPTAESRMRPGCGRSLRRVRCKDY